MSAYYDEMCRAMTLLGADRRTVFLGQSVAFPGTSMSGTLQGVPKDKLIELPVAEEMQMGQSIGLALAGFVPVTLYPRWNFLLLATNQIVNHLDKLPLMSTYRPRVIVRVGIATDQPLDPQHQHLGDFTSAFKFMCKTIRIIRLERAEDIVPAYQFALERDDGRSTILVEQTAKFSEE